MDKERRHRPTVLEDINVAAHNCMPAGIPDAASMDRAIVEACQNSPLQDYAPSIADYLYNAFCDIRADEWARATRSEIARTVHTLKATRAIEVWDNKSYIKINGLSRIVKIQDRALVAAIAKALRSEAANLASNLANNLDNASTPPEEVEYEDYFRFLNSAETRLQAMYKDVAALSSLLQDIARDIHAADAPTIDGYIATLYEYWRQGGRSMRYSTNYIRNFAKYLQRKTGTDCNDKPTARAALLCLDRIGLLPIPMPEKPKPFETESEDCYNYWRNYTK